MTLNLSLPAELEARLRQRAARAGQTVDAFVRDAVEEKLASDAPAAARGLTPEQRLAAFEAWIADRPRVDHFVDDSRAGVYGPSTDSE